MIRETFPSFSRSLAFSARSKRTCGGFPSGLRDWPSTTATPGFKKGGTKKKKFPWDSRKNHWNILKFSAVLEDFKLPKWSMNKKDVRKTGEEVALTCFHMAVCQNLVPLVNIKIAGKWMFIPVKMVSIGIDPYPYVFFQDTLGGSRLNVGHPGGDAILGVPIHVGSPGALQEAAAANPSCTRGDRSWGQTGAGGQEVADQQQQGAWNAQSRTWIYGHSTDGFKGMLVFRVLNHLEPSSCRFACRRNQAFKSTQKKIEAGQPRKNWRWSKPPFLPTVGCLHMKVQCNNTLIMDTL